MRGSRFAVLIAIGLCMSAVASLTADEPPAAVSADRLHGEVSRLLGELDSDRFEVRHRAAERLEALVAKPELGRMLADEFRRMLVRPDVSFEVRWQLTRWSRRLPTPGPEPVAEATAEELERLTHQLDDNSYAVRLGAAERVDWLAKNPKLVCPLMVQLKRRLADPALDAEPRESLESAWQRVRGVWLLSDPSRDELPAVSDEQIGQWLDDLTRRQTPGEMPSVVYAQGTARRELLDLLARDAYVPRLKSAIQSRLDRVPDADAGARLKELLDWTKPAIVAEYWQRRRHLVEQHLLLGVPTLSPGAAKPTHFDRCDDRVAHCVTGNSLSPGDYPVGVAFPHPDPRQLNTFFHLVNLPTPRRRMAYACSNRISDSKRLASISRRTLDRYLADKSPLSERELSMLADLDPAEVSRFAGRYFLLLDDGATALTGRPQLAGRPSRFGMICTQLAIDGTKDAMPGLTDALAKDVFLPPNSLAPYRLHWLAALSIAARDPWPQSDAWLAGCIASHEPLNASWPAVPKPGVTPLPKRIDDPQNLLGPELGATAAALLLVRHGRVAAQFGLQPVVDSFMAKLHVDGYRFSSDEARKKVQQWWEREKVPATAVP